MIKFFDGVIIANVYSIIPLIFLILIFQLQLTFNIILISGAQRSG